jgi:hypothetical protein
VLIGFSYTVYLSFAAHWWWFIVGFFAAGLVAKRESKSKPGQSVGRGNDRPRILRKYIRLAGLAFQNGTCRRGALFL